MLDEKVSLIYLGSDEAAYQTMQDYGGYDYPIRGLTKWDDYPTGRVATIFMMDPDWYRDQDQYQCVLGHELRHVFEGSFHTPTDYDCT